MSPASSEDDPSTEAAEATEAVVAEVREALEKRGEDLGAFIRKQRDQANLSLRKLSKLAGVSNPYLSQIERGLRNPSAEILQAIAKALDLSAETLYVRAGILDERTDSDVESAIARDPLLTEHQRATLLEMYRTFRSVNAPAAAAPDAQDEVAATATPAASVDEDDDGRSRVVGRVVDAVSTGDVTDADIAATTVAGEDPAEA